MQKLLVLVLALLCLNTTIAQDSQTEVAVYFDKNKSELTFKAQNTLSQTLQSILNLEEYAVKIEAHTDNDGSLTYNQLLSERRADAVYEFLLLQGMNTQDLQIVAQGETNPAFSNQTQAGQQQNRRVDVYFITKASLQQTTRTVPKMSSFQDLQKLTTSNTEQSFTVPIQKKQTIEARKGTKVTIPSNAFTLEDGSPLPPNAKVEIEIQEAISLEDMLLNNLSTMSGDQMLETAGMVQIQANYQGKPLQLGSGKNIEVQVPKLNLSAAKQKGMELFYGVSQDNGVMDWKPTNKKVKTTAPHPIVEIDITGLEDFNLPTPQLPKLGVLLRNTNQSISKPKKPYKPRTPIAPNREKFTYRPNGLKKMLSSKKKKGQVAEERYQQALKKYEESMVSYQERSERYDKAIKKYNINIEKYRQSILSNKDLMKYNMRVVDTLYVEMFAYNEYLHVRACLKKLQDYITSKGLTSKKPETVYDNLYNQIKVTNAKIDKGIIAERLGISEKQLSEHFGTYYQKKNKGNAYKAISAPAYKIKGLKEVFTELNSKYYAQKETMGIYTNEDFGYFTATVSQLGWINIDRWREKPPMQQVMVMAQKDENTRFFAISHQFNSCFSVQQRMKDGKLVVNLPIGEQFSIIGLRIENQKFHMADKSFEVTSNEVKVPLQFENKTLADLKQRIRDIEVERTI